MSERKYAEAFLDIQDEQSDDKLAVAIEEYANSTGSFDEQVKIAMVVQSEVSRKLPFKSISERTNEELTPELIKQSERINCYGNVIVTSELLEENSISHVIGFAGGHSFIMMCDEKNERSFMLDSSRLFRLDCTSAISAFPPKEWQLGGGPLFADIRLMPNKLLAEIDSTKNRDEAMKATWLGYDNTRQLRDVVSGEYGIQTRLYPSLPGREILEIFYNSIIHTYDQNEQKVLDDLSNLYGVYPDADRRSKLQLARRSIRILMQQNQIADQDVIEATRGIQESIPTVDRLFSKRADNKYLLADTLRDFAKKRQSKELLQESIDEYKKLPASRIMRLKLKKAQDLMAEIDNL